MRSVEEKARERQYQSTARGLDEEFSTTEPGFPPGYRMVASGIPSEEVSILDALITLARHRRTILRCLLAGLVVGILLSLLLPNRYTATTSILPPAQNPSVGSALLSQLGNLSSVASMTQGSLGLKNPNDLQVAMLESRTVEDAVIDRFDLMKVYGKRRKSDTRKKLERYVSIESGAKDGLIRISVTDSDPRRATEMANGYVEEFMKASAHLATTEASQRRLFFERQLASAKDDLANAEEDLKRTEQKTGLVELDSQARAVIASVAQLRAQIAAKEVQIQGMQSFATSENSDLRVAQEELAGLRAQLEKTGASADQPFIPRGSLQQAGLDYVRKVRDVKYYETIFDLLARQYEVAKVDEARQGAIVQVVDKAVYPDRRSSPKPLYLIPGCIILGGFVGVVSAFASAAANRLKVNPAEQERLQTLRGLLSKPGRP